MELGPSETPGVWSDAAHPESNSESRQEIAPRAHDCVVFIMAITVAGAAIRSGRAGEVEKNRTRRLTGSNPGASSCH
jgi:hypothetical protein